MRAQTLFALVSVMVLIVSMTGVAAAQPGNSEEPPDELPSVVPDFVADLLESISGLINSVLDAVGSIVEVVTPDESNATLGEGR